MDGCFKPFSPPVGTRPPVIIFETVQTLNVPRPGCCREHFIPYLCIYRVPRRLTTIPRTVAVLSQTCRDSEPIGATQTKPYKLICPTLPNCRIVASAKHSHYRSLRGNVCLRSIYKPRPNLV